ncbi:hypothetical protein [Metabacillus arenae]|uniref:Uncharacterized protein n=1 Tax=Metabacillus arenae TaxID=2771434 RepID=A0A926RX63_9BACI|nr:hypothetical protein [Metabacillus arenae]MBD1380330.1 hypothetical protein [Metabacillus arenae]
MNNYEVIGYQTVKDNCKMIYYLNEAEPSTYQLQMLQFSNQDLILTVFNGNSNHFEDITCLFNETFLKDLKSKLVHDL